MIQDNQDELQIGELPELNVVAIDEIIFHDPYWGKGYARKKNRFEKQVKYFNNWMWAICV